MYNKQPEARLILAAIDSRISEAHYYEKQFLAGGLSDSAARERAVIDILEGIYYQLGITDRLNDVPR